MLRVFGENRSTQTCAGGGERRVKVFLLGLSEDVQMGEQKLRPFLFSLLLWLGRWCLVGVVVGDLVLQLIVGHEVQGSSLYLQLASA